MLDAGRVVVPDAAEGPAERGWPRARVLVADDDDAMRSLLKELFERLGFQVEVVTDGAALWARLEAMRSTTSALPDAVVTDIEMPGCSGLEVLEALSRWSLDVPVVVVTGVADPAVEARANRLGARAYFEKPVELSALRRALLKLSAGAARPSP